MVVGVGQGGRAVQADGLEVRSFRAPAREWAADTHVTSPSSPRASLAFHLDVVGGRGLASLAELFFHLMAGQPEASLATMKRGRGTGVDWAVGRSATTAWICDDDGESRKKFCKGEAALRQLKVSGRVAV